MTDENLIPISAEALGVLRNMTVAGVAGYPVAEQIKIYQALPEGQQKMRAAELARALSRVGALQFESRDGMAGQN